MVKIASQTKTYRSQTKTYRDQKYAKCQENSGAQLVAFGSTRALTIKAVLGPRSGGNATGEVEVDNSAPKN